MTKTREKSKHSLTCQFSIHVTTLFVKFFQVGGDAHVKKRQDDFNSRNNSGSSYYRSNRGGEYSPARECDPGRGNKKVIFSSGNFIKKNLKCLPIFRRALQERFEFLSGRWYELRDVSRAEASKDVEGEDGADVKGGGIAVEFRCLTCNSSQVSGSLLFLHLQQNLSNVEASVVKEDSIS